MRVKDTEEVEEFEEVLLEEINSLVLSGEDTEYPRYTISYNQDFQMILVPFSFYSFLPRRSRHYISRQIQNSKPNHKKTAKMDPVWVEPRDNSSHLV